MANTQNPPLKIVPGAPSLLGSFNHSTNYILGDTKVIRKLIESNFEGKLIRPSPGQGTRHVFQLSKIGPAQSKH